tara:strand:- start:1553 stop:3259 length:1707 start_codon:yes stop_codon:yes gene_type:complete
MSIESSDNEIELIEFIKSLKRYKFTIAKFSLVGILLSSLFAFNTKRIYEGEFQIVIDNNKASGLSALSNLNINSGSGLSLLDLATQSTNSNLKTDIGILKSPSVLLNVLEFVKKEKSIKKGKEIKLRFKNWKKNFTFRLEKGTSILNIVYRDKDKDIILPVLEKISKSYQDYSRKDERRKLELGLKFYKEQIDNFSKRSLESIAASQEFGLKYGLSLMPSPVTDDYNEEQTLPFTLITNVEQQRRIAEETIRQIDIKTKRFDDIEDDPYKLMIFVKDLISNDGDEKECTLCEQISNVESELSNARSIFKENDKTIQRLLDKKKVLNIILKKSAKDIIEVQRFSAEGIIESSRRPKGVLLEYKRLLIEEMKDKATLDRMENQYRLLSLENTKEKDPWKLITNPTLYPFPVAPNRTLMIFIGFLGSSFLGLIFSTYRDYKSGILYSINSLKQTFGVNSFIELKTRKKDRLEEDLILLINSAVSTSKKSIAIIGLGKIKNEISKLILEVFQDNLKGSKIEFLSDLKNIHKFTDIQLIVELGVNNYSQISDLKNKLSLAKRRIDNLIILNNE